VESGIDKIFGSSSSMLFDAIEAIYPDVKDQLSGFFVDAIGNVAGITMEDSDGDGFVNVTEGLDSVKGHIAGEVGGMLTGLFDEYLSSFADFIVETIDVILQPDDLKAGIIGFIKDNINVLRAEMVLTVWEVRG